MAAAWFAPLSPSSAVSSPEWHVSHASVHAHARGNAFHPTFVHSTGALGYSLKGALSIFFLFSLMIFVFTVLGVQLFGKLDMSGSDVRFGFQSPYHAFLTVCSLFTAEDWADIAVYTMIQSQSWASFFYFLAAFIIGAWILASLLISTFVDAFIQSRKKHDTTMSVLQHFTKRGSLKMVRPVDRTRTGEPTADAEPPPPPRAPSPLPSPVPLPRLLPFQCPCQRNCSQYFL